MSNGQDMYAVYSQDSAIDLQNPRVVQKPLNKKIIKRHLQAHHKEALIALPIKGPNDTCRFAMIDVQPMEIESEGDECVWEQVMGITHLLRKHGIQVTLSRSPKSERYNIWIVFSRPLPTRQMVRFLDTLLACCKHRTSIRTPDLHLDESGHLDARSYLPQNNRIETYPKKWFSEARDEFVLLPCLIENGSDYRDVTFSESESLGERMFLGGQAISDHTFSLYLNDPIQISPANFVYDPIFTSEEFDRIQFTGSEQPIEKVIARVKGVQAVEHGFRGCCPAHIDFARSLFINEDEEGRIEVYCSKGCSFEDILKTLNPSTRDWLIHVDRLSSPRKSFG